MGAKQIKKNQKNEKLVPRVMICDVIPRKKIPNMVYQGFIEKLFTKNALRRTSLGFLPN
jgi:hypothetical protein